MQPEHGWGIRYSNVRHEDHSDIANHHETNALKH